MRRAEVEGTVERDGVRIHFEIHGSGPVDLLLIPPWAIAHGKTWRANVDYLSRYFRVIIFDPRGNGQSDRPQRPDQYGADNYAADALAVLDAAQSEKAALVSYSWGSRSNLVLCAQHPERVHCSVFCTPSTPLLADLAAKRESFLKPVPSPAEGWDKFNQNYWKENWPDFVDWFINLAVNDPHSHKGIELFSEWGLETDGVTMANTILGDNMTKAECLALAEKVSVPTLVIAAEDDTIRSVEEARIFADVMKGSFILAEGCGHPVHTRYPVWFNLTVRDFVDKATPYHHAKLPREQVWRRAMARPKRVLFLSSPIGLGHARRDAAIAAAMRRQVAGLEVDWLSQSPADKILGPRGEKLLDECKFLLSEIDLYDAQTIDHCQPVFPIFRSMDTIMVNNFHVFLEALEAKQYDLVVADEGWEVDHFLHEHPELKRTPFVWMTDYVGMSPTATGDEAFDPMSPTFRDRAYEEAMCRDVNEQMVTRMERFRRVRDASIFIGERADIIEGSLGNGLPTFRDHVDEYYQYGGYVLGFDPKQEIHDREAVREELGYGRDEKICIVAVGGMSAGHNLLRKAIDAFPFVKRELPELRMIVIGGPRISPESLYSGKLPDGLEIKGFVHNLYRNMAVCDLAVVHGGLTQTMDLTATGVPFIVIPYLRQFEQELWVRHRLANYGATNYADYRELRKPDGPRWLAAQMIAELRKGHRRSYRPVADDADRTAKLILPYL